MTTNVPMPIFADTGVVVPTEADIIAGLWKDFQTAFGGNLYESPATPQGQIVTSLAAALGAANDLLLFYVNQVDPAFASGRMQDAIARIYYLERISDEATIATCICTGLNGTVIPAGSLAQAVDGTIFQSLSNGTIGIAGTVTIQFAAITTGPITCPVGTLNKIYRVLPGWDSITNPADATIGRALETRTEFEDRRRQSVAANARGIVQAIQGAVLDVPGVVDAYVYDNATAAAATVGGVSITARSIYVAVFGGTDASVAKAIWSKKSPGCAYTGGTTVTVVDDNPAYALPYPSYSVKFQRAAALPIYFAVSLAMNSQVPSDAALRVQNAIVAAFNGDDGSSRQRIGGTVFALRFATALAALGPWVQLLSIAVGTSASPTSNEVLVNINQIPVTDAAHIAVTIA